MTKLLKYLKNYKKEVIIAPLFKFLEACFEIVIPIFMKIIIDKGINVGGAPDKVLIYKLLGIMVGMGVLGLITALIAQYFSAVAGMGMGTVLRNECYRHMNRLTAADIDKFGSSTVVNRLTSDINQVSNGVNRFLRLFLRSPFIILGTVIMSFVLNPLMGLIVLAAVPVIVLIVYLISRFTVPKYKEIQKDADEVALAAKENLEGVRVIRAFAKQDNEKTRFGKITERLSTRQVKAAKVSALLNPLTYAVANAAIVLILWFGGISVTNGKMTAGEITTLVNYILQILNAVLVLSTLVVILSKAQASAVRVSEFLNTKPSFNDDGNSEVEMVEGSYKVEFDNVSFAYTDGKNALENINLQASTGETIGIIGGTGSGKTTLINLIPRLYDVSGGAVKVDGTDVRNYPFSQLRNKIAVAVQHAVLFKGTIRSNMLFAKPDATDEEIIAALKAAEAYSFVMEKAGGLDAEVAKNGANFSGGQKQRLNVARAIIANPEILILDDSSSALDYATDLQLRHNLKAMKNMTVFIVSQRVASVMSADKILVLEDGKAVGIGSHEQLYKKNAVYTEIYDSQTKTEKEA